MRYFLIVLFLAIGLGQGLGQNALCAEDGSAVDKQPIVLIVFDDLVDLDSQKQLHGPTLETPNFDRLATMSTRFSNAFASVAVCNPSRSSFMTGQSPFRTTIHVPEPVQWNNVLPAEATIVELVDQAGFQTLSCGKVFHNQSRPADQVMFSALFDENFQYLERPELPTGEIAVASEEIQADDIHVDWAISKLNEYEAASSVAPFFLSVGNIPPQAPFIAPQEYFDLYSPTDFNVSNGFAEQEADLDDVSGFYHQFRLLTNYHNYLTNNELAVDFAHGYFASVSYADALLGRLLDAIESNPDLSDAMVIVTSDNGYQLGQKKTWNKFTLWEASTKIPMYVMSPALESGTVCDVPVSLLDLAPTIAAAGEAGTLPRFDGQDIVEIANNPADYEDRVAISSMIGSLSVRNKNYRLILYNDGSMEFYDVVNDPEERDNLVNTNLHQTLINELLTVLGETALAQGALALPLESSIRGTEGNDTLFAIGAQAAAGGAGNDMYFVSDGAVVTESPGDGYDTVVFADTDFHIPDEVEFVRSSTYSNNQVYIVHGNASDNRAMVTSARADLRGNGGNDTLLSGNGRDVINGGAGNDLLWTTGGRMNLLVGGAGSDVIIASEQNDIIRGGFVEEKLAAGQQPSLAGDFVITGDVYEMSSLDCYLENGDVVLGNGTVIEHDTIALIRRDNSFFSYGIEILEGQGDLPVALDLESVNEILSRGITGDFFLVDGASQLGDEIHCGAGGDAIFSQSGGDQIFAGNGNDLVVCGAGDNMIEAGEGRDIVRTLDGADSVYGGKGDDNISTGKGNDFVNGGGGNNRIQTGADADTVVTLSGSDWIDCGTGNDVVISGSGQDTVSGGSGDDEVHLGGGNDMCSAGSGNDMVFGGNGSDNLSGNAGNDTLYGQGGDDHLFGGRDDDLLEGGAGVDRLYGQSGVDTFKGGPGDDQLFGGSGADRFWFPGFGGSDQVMDFDATKDFIVVPRSSNLHLLTDEEIIGGFLHFDGQDSTIFDRGKSLVLLNTTPAELFGRLTHED